MNPVQKFLVVGLAIVTASAGAFGAPRLWEIKGQNKTGSETNFYILAVTHNGLDEEYDDYLSKVVVPRAIKADAFLDESAVLTVSDAPECPTPLAHTPENTAILEKARSDTARAEFDLLPEFPDPPGQKFTEQERSGLAEAMLQEIRRQTDKLSEYGLIVSIGTSNYNARLHNPERFPKADHELRLEIADYLARLRKKSGKPGRQSIDSMRDLVDVYCQIPGDRRGPYLAREISQLNPAELMPMTKEKRKKANADFVHSLMKGRLSGDFMDNNKDEYSRNAVCDRNEKWLAKMTRDSVEGTRFYALGAAHVLQAGEMNPERCDGLLVRLRAMGFSVELVLK